MGKRTKLQCSSCGADATASCECGVAYVPAGKRAADAIAADAKRSDRVIAERIGVSDKTVAKARKEPTAEKSAVGSTNQKAEKPFGVGEGKRLGKDGKWRKAREPRKAAPKAKSETIDMMADEPCADCNTQEDFWHRSLANMAGEAISLPAYWTQQFGDDWEKFEVPSHLITLAKQAAETWNDIVESLEKRRKPQKPDADVIKQAGNFHIELMKYTADFCASVKAWHAANEIDEESHDCVVQALEMASMRLQQTAQDIDDR
jgi:hypothetical protein